MDPTQLAPQCADLATAPPTLRLRIHHLDCAFEDRIVEDGRCTIGAGPRCTIRLGQPGMYPLHCLIVHRGEETAVRRWSAGTTLNGQDFDAAALSTGDRLQVGSTDIEVLSIEPTAKRTDQAKHSTERSTWAQLAERFAATPLARASSPLADQAAPSDDPASAHGTTAEAGLPSAAEEVFRQLRAANETSRQRARRLARALREDRRVRQDLESQLEQLQQQLQADTSKLPADQPQPQQAGLQEEAALPAAPEPTANSTARDSVETAEQLRHTPDVDRGETIKPSREASTPKLEVASPRDASRETDVVDQQAPQPPEESDEPTYTALVAERIARIEELERELGICSQAHDDVDAASENDSPSATIESSVEIADEESLAANPGEITNDQGAATIEEIPGDREPVASEAPSQWESGAGDPLPLGESAADDPTQAWEPNSTGSDLAADRPDDESVEPAAPADAGRPGSLPEVSTDAASFWGFGDDPACVDDELLGPVALSTRRSRHHSASDPASPTEPPVEMPGDAAVESTAQPMADETSEPDSAAEPPVALQPPGDEPTSLLPPNEPERTHLGELSIWKADSPLADLHTDTANPADENTDGPAAAPADETRPEPSTAVSSRDDVATLDSQFDAGRDCEPAAPESAEPAARELPSLSTAFDASPQGQKPGAEVAAADEGSFIDRYAHLFTDDDSADPPAAGAVEQSPIEPESPIGKSAAAPADGNEEESIDDYMAQLMSRIRGKSSSTTSEPTQYQPTPSGSDTQGGAAAPASDEAQPPPADLPPMTLEELKTNVPLPEMSTDMSALRDLANQTARSAIGVHASRKKREYAISKLAIAGAAIGSGMYLLLTAPGLMSLQFFGACLALASTLYWGIMILRSLALARKADPALSSAGPDRAELPIDGSTAADRQQPENR